MNEGDEIEQLRELIEDFPGNYSTEEVEKVNALLKNRYDSINELLPTAIMNVLFANSFRESILLNRYIEICLFVQNFLFIDIINIAGEFRDESHIGKGKVYFGGQENQSMRHRFSGCKPHQILPNLEIAFGYLVRLDENDAVENAFRFYQKFVNTHPFYDGNGRIARLFVNGYLFKFDKFVDWKNLHSTRKFLRKLNYFHKTQSEDAFQYWMQVCKRYIYNISSEDKQ